MSKIGLITLHGIGETTDAGYADPFFGGVRQRIGTTLSRRLVTEAVLYQDIVEDNQRGYYDRVDDGLGWRSLREFALLRFGDAGAFDCSRPGKETPYYLAQERILNALHKVHRRIGDDGIVIVVGYSLGAHIMSNYFWDASGKCSHSNGVWGDPPTFETPSQEAFCRGFSTTRFFTIGCNIPLFVAGKTPSDIKVIDKPRPDFEWHNYYEDDDVLGWPLRPLNDAYKALVDDHLLHLFGFRALTPLAHGLYWKNSTFQEAVADYIRSRL